MFVRKPQQLGIVALDGIPLNMNGSSGNFVDWQSHIGVPPGARVEFIVKGPPAGLAGLFVTRTVDTGSGGENDPNRALATITASEHAPVPRSALEAGPAPLPPQPLPWLGNVPPVRTRRLYFSEKLENPNDPSSATTFYITETAERWSTRASGKLALLVLPIHSITHHARYVTFSPFLPIAVAI